MGGCGGDTETGIGEAKTRETRTGEENQRTGEKASQRQGKNQTKESRKFNAKEQPKKKAFQTAKYSTELGSTEGSPGEGATTSGKQ